MRRLSVIVVSDTDSAGTLTRAGVRAHDPSRGAQKHPPNEDEIDLISSASMNPGRSLTDIEMQVGKWDGQRDHAGVGRWQLARVTGGGAWMPVRSHRTICCRWVMRSAIGIRQRSRSTLTAFDARWTTTQPRR